MANLRVDKITSTETFETTGSVNFDGSGDYLDLGTSSDFTASGDFTVEGWFKLPETGKRTALISDKGWGLAISPTGNSMVTPDTITVSKLV